MDGLVGVTAPSEDYAAQLQALAQRVSMLERTLDRFLGSVQPTRTQPQRATLVYDVKCPDCGAEPGEPCMTSSNKPTNPHLERIREMTRHYMKNRRSKQ